MGLTITPFSDKEKVFNEYSVSMTYPYFGKILTVLTKEIGYDIKDIEELPLSSIVNYCSDDLKYLLSHKGAMHEVMTSKECELVSDRLLELLQKTNFNEKYKYSRIEDYLFELIECMKFCCNNNIKLIFV